MVKFNLNRPSIQILFFCLFFQQNESLYPFVFTRVILCHLDRRHRRRVPRWRATWIELRTAVNIVNSPRCFLLPPLRLLHPVFAAIAGHRASNVERRGACVACIISYSAILIQLASILHARARVRIPPRVLQFAVFAKSKSRGDGRTGARSASEEFCAAMSDAR